jgi:hypothetical protein
MALVQGHRGLPKGISIAKFKAILACVDGAKLGEKLAGRSLPQNSGCQRDA